MSDNQLVLILQNLLLTPASDFYISTLFRSADKQSLDPRVIERIDFGVFEVMGVEFEIECTDFELEGLSNTQVKFDADNNPEIVVEGNQVTFAAKHPNNQAGYERPPQVPAEIRGEGRLVISMAGEYLEEGRLSLTIKNVHDVQGVFSCALQVEGELDTAQVTFSAMSFEPQLNNHNVAVDVELNSVFKDIINKVLNREKTLQLLVDELNTHIATVQSLDALSQVATACARQALGEFKRGAARAQS